MKTKSVPFNLIELLAGALLATVVLAAPKVQAQHSFSALQIDYPRAVHVGDTITVGAMLINNDISQDDWIVTNVCITRFPSSQPIPTGCSTTVIPIQLPGATNIVLADPCFGTPNTVFGVLLHFGDVCFAVTNYPVANCDGVYFVLPSKLTFIGIDTHNRDSQLNCPQGDLTNTSSDQIFVLRPCINCTKTCTTVGDGGTAFVSFSGSVSNCGNIALTNVTVIDSQPVPETVVTNFGTNILLPNHIFTYSGSYKIPSGLIGDTISVSGEELNLGQPVVLTVSNFNTSICSANYTVLGSRADTSNFFLSFATGTDRTYTVEFTPSLSLEEWQPLTNLPGDGTVVIVRDSITNAQRFYRVLLQ